MIQKQTVYLSHSTDEPSLIVQEYQREIIVEIVKECEGYFFTSEQLNEYTQNVIKQALETAADRAEIEDIGCVGRDGEYHEHNIVNEKSITNTFEEIFDKFKQ